MQHWEVSSVNNSTLSHGHHNDDSQLPASSSRLNIYCLLSEKLTVPVLLNNVEIWGEITAAVKGADEILRSSL